MASNPPTPGPNSETEEETVAFRKKRLRRVSFADVEITSVHIFNRDEDFETPPESSSAIKDPAAAEAENEVIGFFRDLADSDDSKEISTPGNGDEVDDDDVVHSRKSFLRPIGSPSPGSSVVGSATSNDEDNFFGPVSASFIRPGSLSDSDAMDDNCDVTMDSTAFSLHYRSIVRSESEELRTPSKVDLLFEEKTPSNIASTAATGSFMELTKAKKPIEVPPHTVVMSAGRDSNDMSLVGENKPSYDYGKLSPTLEALLASGNEHLHGFHVSDPTPLRTLKRTKVDMVQMSCQDKIGYVDGEFRELDEVNVSVDHHMQSPKLPRKVQTANHLSIVQFPDQLSNVNDNYVKAVNGTNMPNDRGTSPDEISKDLQLRSPIQDEPGQLSTRSWVKENLHYDGKANNDLNHNSYKEQESPVAESISSLSAKRQQSFVHDAKSYGQLLRVTPSPKPDSFLSSKQNANILFSSANRSSSMFKIFEPSPLASSLRNGIQRSKLRLSKFISSATSPVTTVVEEHFKDRQDRNVDAPIINLDKHLFSVYPENRCQENRSHVDSDGIRTPKDIDCLNKKDRAIGLAEGGDSLIQMPPGTLHEGSATEKIMQVSSPSQYTWSEKKLKQQVLMPEQCATEGIIVLPRSDSPLMEIKLDDRNDMKTITPENFVPSPVKTLNQASVSSGSQGLLTDDVLQQTRYDGLRSIGSIEKRNSKGSSTCNNNSMEVSYEVASGFAERRTQTSPPLLGNNHFEEFSEVRQIDDNQSSPDLPTFLRGKNALNFHAISPNRATDITSDLIHSKEKLPWQSNETSHGPASSFISTFSNELSTMMSPSKKKLVQSPISKKPTESPSRKELPEASKNNNLDLLVQKEMVSPDTNSNEHGNGDSQLGLHNLQGYYPVQDINSSRQKRRNEGPTFCYTDHPDKISRIESPNIHEHQASDTVLIQDCSCESDIEKKMIEGGTTVKHWRDISVKFEENTSQLLSPFVDKLHIKLIGVLQDVLVHLQKAKKFKILSSQFPPQKITDQLSRARQRREAETRTLLYKLAYEKAKLQLMSVKREKLMRRAQQLSFAIQESQVLKSNDIWQLSFLSKRDIPMVGTLQPSSTVNLDWKHEVSNEKLAALKHEFEALDREIKTLINSFHCYCKIKGESGCSEIVSLLDDHLKKRTSCRIIHEDLQLWKVEALESRNSKLDVLLNYQGFITQRLKISGTPAPSITVTNKLNNVNIMKNLPNMDACVAFAYVLDAETTKKYYGSKSLAQETQFTSLHLNNLLDVIEEVQLSCIEIRSLVNAIFHSSSGVQLDLELVFVDLRSGRKVTMSLDLTCLRCGHYPSEILPYQLEASVTGADKSPLESFSAEIKAAIDKLRVGYFRIIRLCRCVAQVMQSPST